jgi:hypothetical protein
MAADISPQGNANTTDERNLIYGGPTTKPNALVVRQPLQLEQMILTGRDGVGKPINQHLTGRITSATRTRTIEGASTIEVVFADSDRGVLRAPVLVTGMPKISDIATEILNDANTIGAVHGNGNAANLPGGSTYGQQVPHQVAQAGGDEVTRNKQLVVQIGTNRKLPREAVVIAMMTMLDESGGVNVLTPDSNGSSGVMQQTPSQGWGSRAQVNDPVYAINKFYDTLLSVPNWPTMSPWVAAQRVQRSAWTGTPRQSNGYSSEVGGNYHLKYNEALQEVKSTVLNTAVSNNAKGIVSVSQAATAALTYDGVDYTLVRVQTANNRTTLTFEDAQINQLRRNRTPYTSSKTTSIPLFINQLLAQDGFSFHFVQQGLVVSRVDPTGALNAGQSDPATLANFDELLATDGQRGTGTLRVLTKFSSVDTADPTTGVVTSTDGVVLDSWTVITNLTSSLRWVAMSDGQDFYIGSEAYVSHYINKPPIILVENQDGVGWLNGEFDLGTLTSNTLTFTMTEPFVGVPGQRCVVNDHGLLSGVWMIQSVVDGLYSTQATVTCQRIQADLEDAEHQAATDKLLVSGGGVTSTNSGQLAGAKPQVTGQASMNGWPSGNGTRANLGNFTIPGTSIVVQLNRDCGPLLCWVAGQFNSRVESITEAGGYAYRKDVNNLTVWSNHSSGTALDLNASKHPNGSATARTFSADQIATIHAIVKSTNGAIRWGGDYRSTVDSMHFEVNTDVSGVVIATANLLPGQQVGQGRTTGGH